MKKYVIILLILIGSGSVEAYFHFHKKDRAGFTFNEINAKWKSAKPSYRLLHSGDLIFRHGRGAISDAFAFFSRRESKYSHAGIIHVENEKVYVIHAIGGEENPANKLRKDPLEVFCNPNNVTAFGIYHLDLNSAQLQKIDSIGLLEFKNGLEFDTKFDLQTDDKMYCTEFVYKAIGQVTRHDKYLSLSKVSGFTYVACDDLYLNSHAIPVYSYNY
jgi:hypothetical protein